MTRLGVAALVAIAITVITFVAIGHADADATAMSVRLEWATIGGVTLGILIAFVAMHRMHRHLWAQAQAVDAQRHVLEQRTRQLEHRDAEVHLKTRELERTNAELAGALNDARFARLRAEAMAQQKARLAALLDAALVSAPVGFGFLDEQFRFLRVNATLARYNNRSPEDHIGLTVRDVDGRQADFVEPILQRVQATREPVVNVEYAADAPNRHERRQFLASFFPITTADGDSVGIGAAVADITDRKLLESQLVQAQKMEAVGRLAGGIAHDFNNLLTVIGNYTDLMLRDAHAEQRADLEQIREATTRAATLTRQLLVFSRKQPLELRIVNPNDVVRGMLSMLRGVILDRVDLDTRLDTETAAVRVDVGQLEQVLMNLAINAVDAMPRGGCLTIATQNAIVDDAGSTRQIELKPGRYVLLSITDTGTGMDPETLSHAFEPFFTTKGEGHGTGLGLSTVYGIVTQFGGHITVSSEVGAGTTFRIYLRAVGD
jgi:PAS domain S-box-containing protein